MPRETEPKHAELAKRKSDRARSDNAELSSVELDRVSGGTTVKKLPGKRKPPTLTVQVSSLKAMITPLRQFGALPAMTMPSLPPSSPGVRR